MVVLQRTVGHEEEARDPAGYPDRVLRTLTTSGLRNVRATSPLELLSLTGH